jgi:DNA-binding sugar fermentation-stimulating protein
MKSEALVEWHHPVGGSFIAKVNGFAAMVEVTGIEHYAYIPNPSPAAELGRARDAGVGLLACHCSFNTHELKLVGRVPIMTE